MSQHLINLMSIDYVSLLLALGTIIVGFVAIKKALEEFCQTFGIKLRYIEEKKEMHKCQTEVKTSLRELEERQDRFEKQYEENIKVRDKFNKEIMDCINELKADIVDMRDEMEIREAEKRFKKLRYDILNFANQIVSAQQISAEMIDQIFEECAEYEKISEGYGFKNDRVNVSMSVIRSKYEELLKEGRITK